MQKTEFSKENSMALKGIAIVMMMFHHLFRKASLFKGYKVSFFPLNQEFVVEMSLMFKICVSIFVFITGYGLVISLRKLNAKYSWDKKTICKWTINRLIKTLSGFWIIAVLAYIICQIINGMTAKVFFKDGIIYGIFQMIINLLGLSNLFGLDNFNSTWWYMSIAVLFIISVPIFVKLFKKYGYAPILIVVVIIPRILGWNYVDNSYIAFLLPLLLGIISAENNLIVKIANIKIFKNTYLSKIIKFIVETIIIIALYYLYTKLPQKSFWEVRYGIIPICIICYLYEFFIDLPIIKIILKFLGKHSMNIFLIHTFIRAYYLKDFIYSLGNFLKIAMVLLLISLVISIILELLKKIIKYDKLINKLQNVIDKIIDKLYDNKIAQ